MGGVVPLPEKLGDVPTPPPGKITGPKRESRHLLAYKF